MKEVTLVPTSHVANQSLAAVRRAIEENSPDCVAVELDINRYYAMKTHETATSGEMIKVFGTINFLIYHVMKGLQKNLGGRTGIIPGSEMTGAVEVAAEHKIKVAFIDRDIAATFARLSAIPRRQKLKMLWFLLKGSLGLLFSKIYKGKYSFDLSKTPSSELVKEAMSLLKRELPDIYRILVTERDAYMTARIRSLLRDFDNIVVVIGAGHREGIEKRLQK